MFLLPALRATLVKDNSFSVVHETKKGMYKTEAIKNWFYKKKPPA
jgi:hypothetical protein